MHFCIAVHVLVYLLTVPSGYPRNLTAMAVSSTGISLTWKPLAPEDQNGVITGYVLNVMSLKSKETVEVSVLNSTLQTSVNRLTPYSTYVINIAATTSVGQGPFSPVTTVNTPEDGEGLIVLVTIIFPLCLSSFSYAT